MPQCAHTHTNAHFCKPELARQPILEELELKLKRLVRICRLLTFKMAAIDGNLKQTDVKMVEEEIVFDNPFVNGYYVCNHCNTFQHLQKRIFGFHHAIHEPTRLLWRTTCHCSANESRFATFAEAFLHVKRQHFCVEQSVIYLGQKMRGHVRCAPGNL